MGYAEARELHQKKYGKSLKNSWVTDILNVHGKTKRLSPLRKSDYKYPCPGDVRPNLEKILKALKMI